MVDYNTIQKLSNAVEELYDILDLNEHISDYLYELLIEPIDRIDYIIDAMFEFVDEEEAEDE